MNGYDAALSLLPAHIRAAAAEINEKERDAAMEFRLRLGRRPSLALAEREIPFSPRIVDTADLSRVLECASRASPYTVKESMSQGFIMAGGGVRVGLCGQMNCMENGMYMLSAISSLSIRIPRQVIGCAGKLAETPFVSTLIISPPGWGKTTLLRDMIRALSNGGTRVGLCDERGEVAALSHGELGFDVGACTDVMTGLPKAQGAMALLRSMNPRILAMDEITAPEDVSACIAAANCGVQLLATAHARTREELLARPVYRSLAEWAIFQRLIVIHWKNGYRNYQEVSL